MLSLIFLLVGVSSLLAQEEAIQEISRKFLSGEISESQAMRMARDAGISPEDLQQFQESAASGGGRESLSERRGVPDSEIHKDTFPFYYSEDGRSLPQEKVVEEPTTRREEVEMEHFGYELFKGSKDRYQRMEVGAVDPNYQIGPGDEILLSIWGQVERRSTMTVSREGTIFIEQYGQMIVAGLTLEQLESRLRRNLARIYSGLGSSGGTYLDVSLGKLRSILVYVVGDVENPGSHFLSNYTTAFTALHKAGGATTKGSLRKIHVIRNGETLSTLDLYDFLVSGKLPHDVRLQNNDVVFVPPRINTVRLSGEVRTPAVYELKEEETLKDLVHYSGGIKTTADIEHVQVERITPPSQRKSTSLAYEVLTPSLIEFGQEGLQINPFPLKDMDHVTIASLTVEEKIQWVPGGLKQVYITGHVYKPGGYVFNEGMTVHQLLSKTRGFNDSVFLAKTYLYQAHLIRYQSMGLSREVIPIPLGDVLEEPDSPGNIPLQPQDSLVIFPVSVIDKPRVVSVHGEVELPGNYTLYDNMSLRELLLLSGGFTREAYRQQVDVFRMEKGNEGYPQVHSVELPSGFLRDDLSGPVTSLEEFDMVVVRKDPELDYHRIVYLSGEVKYPGVYSVLYPGENLKSLIERAGGFTDRAFIPGVQYTRNGRQVVGDFSQVLLDENHDILLQNEDSIFIPQYPGTVSVTGNVRNPGLVQYNEGWSVRRYVEAAGGFDFEAAKRRTVIYYPGGNAQRKRWLRKTAVPEGSVIFVPEKPEREPLDINRLLAEWASIATSVAVIFYMVRN